MARVLRLKPGNTVLLCDGTGAEYTSTIRTLDSNSLTMEIVVTRSAPSPIQTPHITLIQGFPKGEKFDLIVQKATELGVSAIIAFPAARSIMKIAPEQAEKRLDRWRKIASEAARQSERTSIPVITLAENLSSVLHAANQTVKFFLNERERKQHLTNALSEYSEPGSVAIMVGPEGGFTAEELAMALSHAFLPVSLGPRILRTETAGLAMLAILQYQWGDMG